MPKKILLLTGLALVLFVLIFLKVLFFDIIRTYVQSEKHLHEFSIEYTINDDFNFYEKLPNNFTKCLETQSVNYFSIDCLECRIRHNMNYSALLKENLNNAWPKNGCLEKLLQIL